MILRGKVSHRLSFASKACVALLGLFVLPASPAGGLAQSTDEPSAARAKPATAAVQAKPAAPADPAQAGRPSPEARLDQLETNFQRILAELSALRASLETSRSEGAVAAPAGSARAGRAWVQAVAPPAALPKATTLPQVPGVPYGARPDKVQLRQGYWSPKTIQPETVQPVEVEAASADSLDSLSPEQRDELKRLDDDFQRDMDELRQRMKEISRQHQKALEKVLTPEQRQELKARRALPMSRRPAKIRETEEIEVSK